VILNENQVARQVAFLERVERDIGRDARWALRPGEQLHDDGTVAAALAPDKRARLKRRHLDQVLLVENRLEFLDPCVHRRELRRLVRRLQGAP
jgi:hypothetical protein